MTEHDWLTGSDPTALLAFAEGRASPRKLRLFACACVRRGWSLLRYRAPRHAVETAERYAEGQANDAELGQARDQAEVSAGNAPEFEQYAYQAAAACVAEDAAGAARGAVEAMRQQAIRTVCYELTPGENEGRANALAADAEGRAQCDLLRELLGNPYRPLAIDVTWLAAADGAARAMSEWIEREQRFDELPYLADALTDAGCRNDALLDHLRGPDDHYRGCWALDALLGRG